MGYGMWVMPYGFWAMGLWVARREVLFEDLGSFWEPRGSLYEPPERFWTMGGDVWAKIALRDRRVMALGKSQSSFGAVWGLKWSQFGCIFGVLGAIFGVLRVFF